jgi:hypothetical protein
LSGGNLDDARCFLSRRFRFSGATLFVARSLGNSLKPGQIERGNQTRNHEGGNDALSDPAFGPGLCRSFVTT